MESASKALIMIASVLIAVVVMGFMRFSFNRMGTWATAQDQEVLTEQVQKFNKEYEAYDKDLMFGVDVISCLNKVVSNNEKIINHAIINGEKYDETYEVQVKLTIKAPLKETMTVYYMKNNKEFEYADQQGPNRTRFSELRFEFWDKPYANKSSFNQKKSETIKSYQNLQYGISTKEFELTFRGNGQNESDLRELISITNTLSETIINKDRTTSSRSDGWTKAVFRSAMYDMKTRKFTCTNLTYNAQTGRINGIEFKEI